MNKRKFFFSILAALILLALLSMCLGRRKPAGDTIISGPRGGRVSAPEAGPQGSDRRVLPDESRRIPEVSTEPSASPRLPETVFQEIPSIEPTGISSGGPRPLSRETRPSQRAQTEAGMKRSVPKPPPVVLPPGKMPIVKLCGGVPISQCVDRDFTYGDFAFLLLDTLDLKRTETWGEAFEILESLHIGPVEGWAKANPQKPMTLREMEEVRCSISLASEEGLIGVGPSTVTAAVNRFCRELKVSLKAMEDSGIVKNPADISAITGYQGGTDQVASPPF